MRIVSKDYKKGRYYNTKVRQGYIQGHFFFQVFYEEKKKQYYLLYCKSLQEKGIAERIFTKVFFKEYLILNTPLRQLTKVILTSTK